MKHANPGWIYYSSHEQALIPKRYLMLDNRKYQFIIAELKVADVMQIPTEGEFVKETDTMDIAMHRIVMGHHHMLLVTRDNEIVGILRSTDVFNALYDMLENTAHL